MVGNTDQPHLNLEVLQSRKEDIKKYLYITVSKFSIEVQLMSFQKNFSSPLIGFLQETNFPDARLPRSQSRLPTDVV